MDKREIWRKGSNNVICRGGSLSMGSAYHPNLGQNLQSVGNRQDSGSKRVERSETVPVPHFLKGVVTGKAASFITLSHIPFV